MGTVAGRCRNGPASVGWHQVLPRAKARTAGQLEQSEEANRRPISLTGFWKRRRYRCEPDTIVFDDENTQSGLPTRLYVCGGSRLDVPPASDYLSLR